MTTNTQVSPPGHAATRETLTPLGSDVPVALDAAKLNGKLTGATGHHRGPPSGPGLLRHDGSLLDSV